MCGRFSQGEPSRHVSDYFGAYPDDDLPDGLYNVPPTETIRIVVERDGERRLAAARWGFRPFWLGSDGSRSWINARSETAAASPAFGPALRSHRCVIPADAFYEWDASATPRQPYAIGREDGRPLVLAGLWAGWRDPASDPEAPLVRRTFTIVTTTPNAVMAELHDRMPVVLPEDAWERWLDPAPADPGELLALLQPTDEVALRAYAVERLVNDVRRDGPELLVPMADDALAAASDRATLGL